MTNNINTSGFYVDDEEAVIEEEKAPITTYGSLDFGLNMFSCGCKVYKAGADIITKGIVAKKEPRSPHMIIFDSIEGRL